MPSSAGAEFAAAVAAKDWQRAEALLDPGVDFRALTPRRTWEASEAATVTAEVLSRWFGASDVIDEVVAVEEREPVADRSQVSYRLRGHNGDGPFVVEQQAFYSTEDGRITWMRILCSGFRPDDPAAG
ncbi:MAG: hypothetical protein KDB58_04165 [Solirubrobacterales bacterium]|nr:hypothetical protein [Solirubrobacterales bacterium]MCB8971011.1 hypothetical protein [Thermoleophilales bacterium]MCO5326095.1 hypothetical protein [Solirubrobacterales bacterium]